MRPYMRSIKILFLMGLVGAQAQASSMSAMSVLPYAVTNMSDVAIDSQLRITRSGNDITYLDIYLSCFGTNLRAVANPISPNSTVVASLKFKRDDGTYKTYKVTFPAGAAVSTQSLNQDLTATSQVVDTATNTVLDTFNARLRGNLIRVQMKNTETQSVDLTTDGVMVGHLATPNAKSALINSILFEQVMPPNTPKTQFMGTDGPLSANVKWYFSENGKYATVYAAFPGENKFCGGYFSPLMLSFDEDVPSIDGTSKFKLYPKAVESKNLKLKYSWPNFKNKVYFLAVDHNNNGKIDGGEELFGDVNDFENGFANLATFDDNKDGVIDKNDAIFSKLVLWRDSNGNGVSEKSEIQKLSDLGVTSISLKFKNDIRYVGDRGKILGPSIFEYKDKSGNVKQGNVWDVFLKLVP